MGTRDPAGREYTDIGSGLSQVVGPVYSLSPSLQKQKSVRSLTPSRFNKVVLNGHFKRDRASAGALGQVEPADIQMYLIFRIKASSKHKNRESGLRQSSVQSYYKTLQMVYYLDTKRHLGKPTNDMIGAIGKHHLSKPMHANQKPVYQKRLDSEVQPRSGDRTKQHTWSLTCSTFSITIGAKMPIVLPPMGAIGFKLHF